MPSLKLIASLNPRRDISRRIITIERSVDDVKLTAFRCETERDSATFNRVIGHALGHTAAQIS